MPRPDRIAIFLGHPAHFHMFKHTVQALESQGIEVDYVIKRKDMLEELVQRSGHPYYVIRRHERRERNKVALALALVGMELRMIAYLFRRRPRLVVGTYAPVLSHLCGVPFVVCCEDDSSVIPHFARTSYPYAHSILAPIYCNGGRWDAKMTKYAGFQKLAYLHPNYFCPNRQLVAPHLRNGNRPYVLMRFAQLRAHHDAGINGIDNAVAERLVSILSDKYDVYISAERPLCPSLEPYRLHINPLDIHHWIAFAELYIGDSQSMAVEAAMLGTPAIRFSGFARRIGVLNTLEEVYHLGVGIGADQPEVLYNTVCQMIAMPDLTAIYHQRRDAMLAQQVDVCQFFTNHILQCLRATSPHRSTST